LGERIHAAIESIRKDVRGLPLDQAEEQFVAALRRHDAFLPPATVRRLAREFSDPWWSVRHPLKAVRQARSEDAEPDLEARRCEAETDRLHERLCASEICTKLRSFSVSSTRTFDGMVYEITIDPWTSDMASRIRELAAPTPVTVNPPP
jgi:hypothetical protein